MSMRIALKDGRLVLLAFVLTIPFLFGPLPSGVSVAQGGEAAASTAGLGTNAPEFDLPDLSGSTVSLNKYKDSKPVLLYFWATWCPYCIQVRPAVVNLRNQVPQVDLEILAINVGAGDSIAKVQRFQESHPASFPVLYDGEGKVARTYMVQGIPMFVLIDKSGVIRYRSTEFPPDWKKNLK